MSETNLSDAEVEQLTLNQWVESSSLSEVTKNQAITKFVVAFFVSKSMKTAVV